ncbi:protein spt2-like protein [Cinnamomum micranthum f. kanehirae]|uniref:Protein spt2-like protein n=1 Tax=Cinnamomum micranthum f. kanehirae TaxID=337451 RepID=A0A443N350_9MAGN|nr:protein spt2-like protein [Cinnamomum micranthum f. kanehirae]
MEKENNPILCANSCGFLGGNSTRIICSTGHKDFLFKKPQSSSNAITMMAIAGKQENQKPTKEELEFLEFRQHLKEKARVRIKKESASITGNPQEEKKKPPNDNYGSFFGPSKIVIAQRVLQECQSILQTCSKKKIFLANAAGKKRNEPNLPKKVCEELKIKSQELKKLRDYSFLMSDDAEFPNPSAPALPISEAQVGDYGASKSKASSMIKSAEPPRQSVPSSKPPKMKLHKQMPPQTDQYRVMQKRSLPSSKRQMKPTERIKPHAAQKDQPEKRPVKRYLDEEEDMDEGKDAISIIRSMFRYDPNKYVDNADDVMEASFRDIEKEEKRSARIARKEDECEQRLIEEEERRFKMRKEAKRRRFSQK